MGFTQAIKTCFNKYAVFSGRAQRSEFGYFVLFYILASLIAPFVEAVLFGGMPVFLFLAAFGLLVPGIAAGVRRLHDLDKSGWWLLIAFIPAIGLIAIFAMCVQPGVEGPNRFGPDPLQASPSNGRMAQA